MSIYWGTKPASSHGAEGAFLACWCLLPSAQLPPEEAQDRGAKDDEDPGVHDGIEGEQAEHPEVLLMIVNSEEVHIHLDLRGTQCRNHYISHGKNSQ